jgi:carboxyl-terminal processing protease
MKKNSSYKSLYLNLIIAFVIIALAICLSFVWIKYLSLPQANVASIKNLINQEFLFEVPSETKLEEGALKGIVGALNDPYSEYFPADDKEKFDNDLNRRYQGIGVVFDFSNKDQIKINSILPSSPAERAELKINDILISVDDTLVKDLNSQEIINRIRGNENTSVKLKLERDNISFDKVIVREKITAELIKLGVKNSTAIITISSFGENLNAKMEEIAKSILANNQIKNVVIDVRNNAGGLLDECINVLSYFVESNTVLLNEKSKKESFEIKSKQTNVTLKNYPITILINEQSASASEILAGALRDQRGAKLIGRKTFGKGVVQKLFPLRNGDSIKLTIAEWFTPNNTAINKVGISPDQELDAKKDALEYYFENNK